MTDSAQIPIPMVVLSDHDHTMSSRSRSRPRAPAQVDLKNYTLGITLLLLVVLLWTISNFVTQALYQGGYNKPFLITYLNTSAFSLYLIPFLLRRLWCKKAVPTSKDVSADDYQPLALDETEFEDSPLDEFSPLRHDDSLPPLSIKETAHLAFAFCLLWFIANWTVNAGLEFTSVASATILTSMSGFFTLAIGRIFNVEKLTILKVTAVCTSFMGVILVSLSDASPSQPSGPASRPTVHQPSMDNRATLGDILALISALFYAIYVILLKVRIKSESRIDMQLFFGFVGLFNIIVCWPIGLVLDRTGAEPFALPSGRNAILAILVNMAITLASDYLYILAMLKTTPLVVTIGLSLTIPLAVLGDFLLGRYTHWEVIAGAVLVLVSFVAVGLEDSRSTEEH